MSENFEVQSENPTFHDLQAHAEAGFVRRALTRYLVPDDPTASIERHERFGTPLIRSAVMKTVGRVISRPGGGGNYRLDHTRPPIEAANNFAFRGSVFNESLHTYSAVSHISDVVSDVLQYDYTASTAGSALGVGFNLGLVALQRYNRARMIQRVDQELQVGHTFPSQYKSWTGIDARAHGNFMAAQDPDSSEELYPEVPNIPSFADTSALGYRY